MLSHKKGASMKCNLFQGVNFLLLFSFMISSIPLGAVQKQTTAVTSQPKIEERDGPLTALLQQMAAEAKEVIRLIDESELIAEKGPTGLYNNTVTKIGKKLVDMTVYMASKTSIATRDKILIPLAKRQFSFFKKLDNFIQFRAKEVKASDFKLSRHNLRAIRFLLHVFVSLANIMKATGVRITQVLGLTLGLLFVILFLAEAMVTIAVGSAIAAAFAIVMAIETTIIIVGLAPGVAAKGTLYAVRSPRKAINYLKRLTKEISVQFYKWYLKGALA